MVDAFKDAGHDVRCLYTTEREVNVLYELEKLEFSPDILLQQESLGCRVFLNGLASIDCVRLFWSVDTHMNMHWHGLYGSMFDGVLTTQKKYISSLEKVCTAKICWVPWMGCRLGPETGTDQGLIPYTKRKHDLTFVGRVSSQRPSRKLFVDFLRANYNLNLVNGLNYSEMMSLYKQTKIVPNEAIFGEVNFRLFEACSCGCAVVTPFVDDELGELFEIGKDIAVYNDVLELKDILDRFRGNPMLAAEMGLAAYERVLREHMPANRVNSILDFAQHLTPRIIDESDNNFLYIQIQAALASAGDTDVSWKEVIISLMRSNPSVSKDTTLLRIFANGNMTSEFLKIAQTYIGNAVGVDDALLNMTASIGSSKMGDWDLARYFWLRYITKIQSNSPETPRDHVHLLMLWGRELSKIGISMMRGVAFNEDKDIPTCASQCLFSALRLDPQNLEIYKRLDALFTGIAGAESMRLAFLSHLSLHYPDDWRLSTELGIVSLKIFRLSEGLTELCHSEKKAIAAGRQRFWWRKIESEIKAYLKIVKLNNMC